MIKQKIHKGIAWFLGIFMFLSASNIAADVHFCNDDIYSISFFGHANSCKKKKDRNSYETYLDKSGCCSSSQFEIETSEDYMLVKAESIDISLSHCFIYSSNVSKENTRPVDLNFEIPSPPDEILSNYLYIELETFLI